MKILVCGGRDYANVLHVTSTLDGYRDQVVEIIHGGAPGADTLAGMWARGNGVRETVFEANWLHAGRAAGAQRNARMLRESRPDLVLAFEGRNGTQDMVERARRAGICVVFAAGKYRP